MLRRLNVSGETPLEVTEEGRFVLIAPAESGSEGARFREAFARVKEKYAEALERLAK
ncbi:MAG: hypothetical protein HYX26_03015 [Acidobacteriales bacterium]|nr:hypothetical protein [Terriglobales bacterium]